MLVADDDLAVRQSTVRILKTLGYVVSEARDGEEVMAKLLDSEVDAVVLDVKMPRRDGISVIEGLDPSPPPPVVLLVSAYDIERQTRARLGTRVHRVLRKPVPPPILIEAVEEAVDLARAARAEVKTRS